MGLFWPKRSEQFCELCDRLDADPYLASAFYKEFGNSREIYVYRCKKHKNTGLRRGNLK